MDGQEQDSDNQKEKSPQKQTTVLILEDHPAWVKILSDTVIGLGFIPVSVIDLRAAQDALRGFEINIVITDIFFEEIHQGILLLDTLREIKDDGKKVPSVIAISGSDRMGRQQAEALFASHMVVDFIGKDSFSIKRLQDALKRAKKENDYDLGYGNLQTSENYDLNYANENRNNQDGSYQASLDRIVNIPGTASGNTIIIGNENEIKISKKKKA